MCNFNTNFLATISSIFYENSIWCQNFQISGGGGHFSPLPPTLRTPMYTRWHIACLSSVTTYPRAARIRIQIFGNVSALLCAVRASEGKNTFSSARRSGPYGTISVGAHALSKQSNKSTDSSAASLPYNQGYQWSWWFTPWNAVSLFCTCP